MSVRWRLGARFFAAMVAAAIPISLGSFSPGVVPISQTTSVDQHSAASVDAVASRSASRVTTPARLSRRQVVPALPPRVVAPQTTIAAGLALRTRAQRHRKISLSSSKGSHVWTASALAEHDMPSAAMRAYRHAARTINAEQPGCALPWTLLAGIGRVESDHGRYGGSVLGNDGVPRPAIVGIALNGKGPVAAIRDTDHGRFDGDRVWDRAVGPMQFIPSTWRSAGRDGDGNGVKSPNDIDDAALAAAAYLCHGGRHLSDPTATRAAIFSYNPSGYYVDLVSAFARGYRTGVFVIPSPPVAAGAGDGVVHLRAAKAAKAAKAARAARAAAKRRAIAARLKARAHAHAQAQARAQRAHRHAHPSRPPRHPHPHPPSGTPGRRRHPPPASEADPTPQPPKLLTARGPVTKSGSGWKIGSVALSVSDLSSIAPKDWDGDGVAESMSDEFDGLAAAKAVATLTYYVKPGFKVNGFSLP